ncbi:MAG: DegV family protein [Erysipelotrichaceae bacterium]
MSNKIAILTDSGSDVPAEIAKDMEIFVIPLQVNYKDISYRDGVDIDAQTVYDRLPVEIPTTSLPSGEDVSKVFQAIKDKGYTHVLAVVLSSGLSGTCNFLRLMAQDLPLPLYVVDTKNIGIGSGLCVIKAAQLVKSGMDWDELRVKMEEVVKKTKVYFVLNTLEYLQKGGRIGKVTALVGYVLDLKPIITCNEDGIYTTIAKARGRKTSITRCMNVALEFAEGAQNVTIGIVHGDAYDEMMNLKDVMQARAPQAKIFTGQVSPALGVHTGPGLLGMGIQID